MRRRVLQQLLAPLQTARVTVHEGQILGRSLDQQDLPISAGLPGHTDPDDPLARSSRHLCSQAAQQPGRHHFVSGSDLSSANASRQPSSWPQLCHALPASASGINRSFRLPARQYSEEKDRGAAAPDGTETNASEQEAVADAFERLILEAYKFLQEGEMEKAELLLMEGQFIAENHSICDPSIR